MPSFVFDFEPVSVNKMYVNLKGQARRFMSKEGREFKAKVADYVQAQIKTEEIEALVGKPLTLFADVSLPSWMLKDGKRIRRKDLDNVIKGLQDSIFEVLQQVDEKIDDSYIWHLDVAKKISEQPRILVEIKEYTSPM